MKVMYMDESGKNIVTQPRQDVFIFGGLILEHDEIYKALTEFKVIYQEARLNLKDKARKSLKDEGVCEDEIAARMNKMFFNFEFHAVNMINRKDNIRKNKKGEITFIEENPWKYCNDSELFNYVNKLFIKMVPYINSIFMFKVDKHKFIEYCNSKEVIATDSISYDYMIDFILGEYHKILKEQNSKGVIVPDQLDSTIRDKFVKKMNAYKSIEFWLEPIQVVSKSNAFTQLIDLITYFYYKVYVNDEKLNNFKAIKRSYNKHLRDILVEKDLIDFLSN